MAELALINLGMSPLQFKALSRDKQIAQEIILSAPVTSFVLARNVTPGQKYNSGEELYRLADLSRVWVLADLFENEAKYIRPGEKVRVTLPHQDEKFMATVSEVLPQFDPATLTLKVRLEVDNPKFALRPGMFMDVKFPINLPASVNVPAEAILDTGAKKIVFVDRGNGLFEPRRVKTGWRLGDRVEILEGLAPGESIVVSGNFLIDSESRMRLAAAGMFGEVTKDAVCGLNVDESKAKAAGFTSTFQDQTYYFCSEGCKQHFDNNPGRYAAKPGEAPKAAGSMGGAKAPAEAARSKDPVCGQEVDEAQAKAGGLTSDYQGKTYYFCRYACNKQFDKNPERYLHPEAQTECGAHEGQKHVVPGIVKDPVCGLEVDPVQAAAKNLTSEYQGKTYYFDQEGCKQRFDQDPQHYLAGESEATLLKTYQNVPSDIYAPQRFDRGVLRSIPQGTVQPVVPPGVTPAVPQGPAQPVAPPGPAQVMPQGPTQALPPGATQAVPKGPAQPVLPGPVQVVPKSPTQPTVPPPGAGSAVPQGPAQPVAPPGPVQVMPQGPTQALPPGATQAVPKGPAQVMPKGPAKAIPPGETRAVPRGPNPELPRGLQTPVTRGPSLEMREAAERGMREREADLKREGKLPVAPPGPGPVAPPKSQVKPQKQQTPPPAPAPPTAPG